MSDADSQSEDELEETCGVGQNEEDEKTVDIFERVKVYKAKGNECYQKKKYRKAIEWYGKVIDLVLLEDTGTGTEHYEVVANKQDKEEMEKEILAAAYCNRAAAYLSCGEWNKTISDSDEVLRLGQSNALTVKVRNANETSTLSRDPFYSIQLSNGLIRLSLSPFLFFFCSKGLV